MQEQDNILARLERIEKILILSAKNVFDVQELAIVLGVSPNHIHHLVSEREIPHYRSGRKIFFSREEVERWQMREKVDSNFEIQCAANTYCATNPLRLFGRPGAERKTTKKKEAAK